MDVDNFGDRPARGIPIWCSVLLGLVDDEGYSLTQEEDALNSSGSPPPAVEDEVPLEDLLSTLLFSGSEPEDSVDDWDWERGSELISFNSYEEASQYAHPSEFSFSQSTPSPSPSPSPRTTTLANFFWDTDLEFIQLHFPDNSTRQVEPPLPHDDIGAAKLLTTVRISEALQCSMCLEDFEIGEEAKLTTCKHRFHEQCILSWLELHGTCPLCRFQMRSANRNWPEIRDESEWEHDLLERGRFQGQRRRRRRSRRHWVLF
ncbi:E3 ubiquitin-protein ligase RNF12-like [Punica granatum]|uniref:RING-type E3 ubiquitin transferase n=2 Tax=Punica granatum TaxID=22663 RepID=A0A218WLK7_PUNGR|nr:E3 ubiquitin-protein ligase RNF12-like [Punica granatum]OWM73240.1 hypothetical protein CDL15_Pgr001354 [Punica granatum]PKI77328.1 hypothetical protein CRG98_002273 [Punica granatum]